MIGHLPTRLVTVPGHDVYPHDLVSRPDDFFSPMTLKLHRDTQRHLSGRELSDCRETAVVTLTFYPLADDLSPEPERMRAPVIMSNLDVAGTIADVLRTARDYRGGIWLEVEDGAILHTKRRGPRARLYVRPVDRSAR